MRRPLTGLLACITLLAGTAPATAGDSLRCGSRVVSTGQLAAEVIATCGEPDFRDVWTVPHPHLPQLVSDREEWYYNFGPGQLLRILRLERGHLASIDSDGYGWAQPPAPPCSPAEIVPGLSKLRLLLRCGEPVTREAMDLLRPDEDRFGRGRTGFMRSVYRERWVYNFGSRQLLRKVSLENGRVTDVDTEGWGFDPRPD